MISLSIIDAYYKGSVLANAQDNKCKICGEPVMAPLTEHIECEQMMDDMCFERNQEAIAHMIEAFDIKLEE